MVRFTITVFVVALVQLSYSQTTNFSNSRVDWKRSKQEIIFGAGYDNFLGDLGGQDRVGTDYSLIDMEWPLKSPSFYLAYRNRLSSRWSTRTMFTYGRIRGNDQLTADPYRNYRNLHFRSNIWELSQVIEWGWSFDRVGHRYGIPGTTGFKNRSTYVYVFAGIGALRFNPKALYNGSWVELQPLGTEGQVVDDSLKKYSRIAATIPMGGGVRVLITKRINIGLEVSFRKVFSDYLDDVSGDYYNNDVIRGVSGDKAAYLADPSSGTNPNWTIQGEQRGDPTTKDAVVFANITIAYNLTGFNNTTGEATLRGLGGSRTKKRRKRGYF